MVLKLIDDYHNYCKYCNKAYIKSEYLYNFRSNCSNEFIEILVFRLKYDENETNHHCIIPIKNKYMNINIL